MEQNGVSPMAQSPPQEGPYSVRKHQGNLDENSGKKTTTPGGGGSFIDQMRNVLHKTAAAANAANYSAEKLFSAGKSSSSGNGSAWGDTPDTAEMERIAQIEREALRRRLDNGLIAAATAGNNQTSDADNNGQQAPPSAGPRHLTFSPVVVEGGPLVARPGSGRLRSTQRRQLSHLGRTSLAASSAAALAAAETRPLPTSLHPEEHVKVLAPSVGTVRPLEQPEALEIENVKRQKIESSSRIESKVDLQPINYQNQDTGAACEFLDSSDDEDEAIAAAAGGGRALEDITAAATAAPPTPPPLELRAHLSPDVAESILSIGGPELLYQWQAECLCRPGVLQGRNLVYCAPTSGGKSLVADIIFLRRLVETGRPGLLVLPFISLCNEKKSYWDNILQPLDREAREYYGPTSTSAPISARTGLIVATLEKANNLITQLLEENALGMLSCVIIDELHMVGDEHRGYQLELMLTKLRFAGAAAFEVEEDIHSSGGVGDGGGVGGGEIALNNSNKQEQWVPMMGLEEGTQIIGMSATLPNVSIVAKWLGAELYTTDFRPVPLRQFLKSGNEIHDESGAVVRTIPDSTILSNRFNVPAKELQTKDPDHVAFLAQETVDEGFSVLVFCATRSASEATATVLAQLLNVPERHIAVKNDVLQSTASKYGIRQVNRTNIAAEIGRLGSSHSKKLAVLVAQGVGYHHAGMEPDDKELLELAFKCGAISVLCATSSLAAGVNLPARRVIFRHPYVGRPTNFLDAANYRQMRGRAGRAGIDTHGESFLLVLQKSTERKLAALMHAEPAAVESCLTQEKCGMKRAMLEVVATGAVISPSDVDRYIKCTLLAATSHYEVVMNATREALRWLGDKERQFIYWDKKTETFQPTAFGKAALGSGLPPELCLGIRADISRARQSFVLTTELHLAYLCVPATEDKSINYHWQRFELLLKNLTPSDKTVAEKVGINMAYVSQKARSFHSFIGATSASTAPATSSASSQQESKASQQREELAAAMSEQDRICQRFGTALLLNDILQEMNDEDIRAKYGLDRAVVLGLRDRACRYAGMIAVFCERLGWHDVELLVSKFQARVLYGVRPEVLCLMEIDHVQAATARMLYKAGLRTPEAVAAVPDVQRVLAALAAGRGGIEKLNDPERAAMTQQAKRIVKNAKRLLENKAKKLRDDAAEALQLVENLNLNQGVVDVSIAAAGGGGGWNNGGGYYGGHVIENNCESSVAIAPPPVQQQQQQYVNLNTVAGHGHRQQQQHQEIKPPLVPFSSELHTTTLSSTTTSSLPTTLPSPLPPDEWEFGRTSGLTTLSTTAHVHALKRILLQGKYTSFAFQFDILSSNMHSMQQQGGSTSITSWSAMPGIPSAARGAGAGAASTRSVGGQQQQQQQSTQYGGVFLSWRENQAFYIPLTLQGNPQLPVNEVISELTDLFRSTTIASAAPHLEKITFNLKGQLTAIYKAAASLSLPAFSTLAQHLAATAVDVRIAAFLLHPEDSGLADGPPAIGSSSSHLQQNQYGKTKSVAYTAEALCATIIGPVAVASATRSLPPPPVQHQCSRLNSTLALGDSSTSSNNTAVNSNVAARNVILLNACFPPLQRELQLKGLYDLFLNIEMPLVSILASMQVAGVGLDPEYLKKEIPVLRQRVVELENLAEQCLLASGSGSNSALDNAMAPILTTTTRSINLNSTDEVAHALYVTLQLAPPPSAEQLKNGMWSTRAENLDELAAAYPTCPLPRIVSEYRTIGKLLAMCTEMLHFATVSGASSNSGNGAALHAMPRIHAMVNQTVAKTGRLSMEAPNLQTVPKPFTFSVSSSSLAEGRSHLGGGAGSGDGGAGGGDEGTTTTTTTTTYVCSLRRSITPPPGMVLIAADYKQLELRMMAHLSGDPQLLALLHDTRIDPFIQLAAKWLNKPSVSAVTPEDRGRAKNLCYALLYGMGKAKLAQDFGLKGPTAEREAENLKNSFLDAFPGLKQWIQRVHMAISNTNNVTTSSGFVSGVVAGEIRTLFGRLRRFPKGSSSGHGGNVGNKALNSLTQGSAADVSKLGMLAVARAIDKLNKASNGGGGSSEGMMVARLVLSIHDEFLVEVDCRHVHRVAMELRNAMEGVVPWLSVPLPVKISIGRSSWGDMEEL